MIPAQEVYVASSDSIDCNNNKGRKFLRPYLNDPIVVNVIERVKSRSDKGMSTYGVPMTRADVTTVEWLCHAQEEALDLAVYLERCIADLQSALETTEESSSRDLESLRV